MLFIALFSLGFDSFAKNAVQTQNSDECTVTRTDTYSVDEFDCEGLPLAITASASCTITASDCASANIAAKVCAGLKAEKMVMDLVYLAFIC